MRQLGRNIHGETLEPGRVPDCHLGLCVALPGQSEPVGVLVVGPAALLHPAVLQPAGTVLYELVTGHPDWAHPRAGVPRRPHRRAARLAGRHLAQGRVDLQAAARAVVAGWQRGDLPSLPAGRLTAEEALALERPAMTYVRAQLGDRLHRQLAWAYRR